MVRAPKGARGARVIRTPLVPFVESSSTSKCSILFEALSLHVKRLSTGFMPGLFLIKEPVAVLRETSQHRGQALHELVCCDWKDSVPRARWRIYLPDMACLVLCFLSPERNPSATNFLFRLYRDGDISVQFLNLKLYLQHLLKTTARRSDSKRPFYDLTWQCKL